ERILILDIGNRYAKIYITEGDELGAEWSFAKGKPDWIQRLGDIAERSNSSQAIIVSVVPNLTEMAVMTLEQSGVNSTVVSGDMDLPMKFDYGALGKLGADRIADAIGAWQFYGEDTDSLLVVDAGTAITIDLVRQGTFLGGAIIPGLDMMKNALYSNTAQLTLPDNKITAQFPGKGTEQCIVAGSISAAVGAIRFLWNKFIQKDEYARIILTGGDSKILAKFMKDEFILDNLLLVKGAIAIFDYCRMEKKNAEKI
ncbi:hypothetical protein DRQ33_04790, partial [bacterium]